MMAGKERGRDFILLADRYSFVADYYSETGKRLDYVRYGSI